jgi:hypothetical protein
MNNKLHKWCEDSPNCSKCNLDYHILFSVAIKKSNTPNFIGLSQRSGVDNLINEFEPCITDDEASIKSIIE